MFKKLLKSPIDLSIIIISIITFVFVAYTLLAPFVPHKFMYYGIVDPNNYFAEISKITMENKFVVFSTNTDQFAKDLTAIQSKKRIPLMTIEPWGVVDKEEYNFVNMQSKTYQDIIKNYCQIVQTSGKKAIFRIGHEMEQVGSRYPWANGDSEGFKNTYKSYINTCKKETKLVEFMWSPAGVQGLEKYYPGDEFVDMIGLSTFGNPGYEEKVLGKKYNFDDHFNERYKRVASYGKDVYLAEFGVAGDEKYKAEWLKKAKESILDSMKYPNLRGVFYFNYKDPNPWVEGTEAPDFGIDKTNYPFNS